MANEDRCWPGYEPVKGKEQHEQGSCRPKADSKLSSSEKEFREKRGHQLDQWKKTHPGSPRKAAQHLSKPKAVAKKTTAAHKTAGRKATAARKA
jgi:hypothetical protein